MNPRNATGAGYLTALRVAILAVLVLGTQAVASAQPPAPLAPPAAPAALATPAAPTAPTTTSPAPPTRVVNAVAELRDIASGGNVVPASGCTSCGSLPGGGPAYGPGVFGWGHKYGPAPCDLGGCGDEGCGEAGCVAGRPP